MLTLGYITKLNNPGDNLFEVRVPILEKAGSSGSDQNLSGSYFQATLCQTPGQYEAYSVGDCVAIGFLDGRMDKPIILGKLFLEGDRDNHGFIGVNSLRVTGKAELPDDTKIGELKCADLMELSRATDFLSEWSKYLNTGYIEANPPAGGTFRTLSSIRIGSAKFIVPTPQPPTPQLQYYQHSIQLFLNDESYMELSLISSIAKPFDEEYLTHSGYENVIAVKGAPETNMMVVHVRRFRDVDKSLFVDYYISGAPGGIYSVKVAKLMLDDVRPI